MRLLCGKKPFTPKRTTILHLTRRLDTGTMAGMIAESSVMMESNQQMRSQNVIREVLTQIKSTCLYLQGTILDVGWLTTLPSHPIAGLALDITVEIPIPYRANDEANQEFCPC